MERIKARKLQIKISEIIPEVNTIDKYLIDEFDNKAGRAFIKLNTIATGSAGW
jgi:hypothetical protein